EVEHHVVFHDLDEDAPILPEQWDVSRRSLAILNDRQRRRHRGFGRPCFGPPKALEQARHERRGRVASSKATGEIENEPAKGRLQRALTSDACGWRRTARRQRLVRTARRRRLLRGLLFPSENAIHELGFFAPTGVEPQSLTRGFKLLAPQHL